MAVGGIIINVVFGIVIVVVNCVVVIVVVVIVNCEGPVLSCLVLPLDVGIIIV